MDLEKFKKLLPGFDMIEYNLRPDDLFFDLLLILFNDGSFIEVAPDNIKLKELETNPNVFRYTYLNHKNRTDILHTVLLFIIFKETEKTDECYNTFSFTNEDYYAMFNYLGLYFREAPQKNSIDPLYDLSLPYISDIHTVRFKLEDIRTASKIILQYMYSQKPKEN